MWGNIFITNINDIYHINCDDLFVFSHNKSRGFFCYCHFIDFSVNRSSRINAWIKGKNKLLIVLNLFLIILLPIAMLENYLIGVL